jgi:hypothetical protein
MSADAGTTLAAAISQRARFAVAARSAPLTHEASVLDPGLLKSLRHHLLAGETHYPARPGMPELRERIGARLPAIGYTSRDAAGVLVTASEGESLLVTLLALGMVPGGFLVARSGGRHQSLMNWLGVDSGPDAGTGTVAGTARYREVDSPSERGSDASEESSGAASEEQSADGSDGSAPTIDATGGLLFSGYSPAEQLSAEHAPDPLPPDAPRNPPDTIVIGDLSSLSGFGPFRLGFVAADPEVVQQITKWKQASSICSPGPSQRAALWALGVRP